MTYSQDLRKRVLSFIDEGGKQTQALALFKISRNTLVTWRKQPTNHSPGKPGPKKSRKFDQQALYEQVQANPDESYLF